MLHTQGNGKLIAPQTRHHILGAHAAGQALPHPVQQLVTDVVTQGFVHLDELIEVQQQKGLLIPTAAGLQHGVAEAIAEQCPVGQIRERVVIHQVFYVFLGPLLVKPPM